jgi:hypothetical protein
VLHSAAAMVLYARGSRCLAVSVQGKLNRASATARCGRRVIGSAFSSDAGRWSADSEISLAPFVPTPSIVVDRAMELARLQPTDTFVDIGCGDGRVVVAAAPWC